MLPLRAGLFATIADPHLVIVFQVLDGLTAAVFSTHETEPLYFLNSRGKRIGVED